MRPYTILFLTALLLLSPFPSSARWTNNAINGFVTVCDQRFDNAYSVTFPLSGGNTLIAWGWQYLESYKIKYQVYTPAGVPLLPESGQLLINGHQNYAHFQVVSDGEGGAIIIFDDQREGSDHRKTYGQRISPNGRELWRPGGQALAVWSGWESMVIEDAVYDSLGNIFLTWLLDQGWINQMYTQKVDAEGNRLWGDYGVLSCGGISNCQSQKIVTDGNGGIFTIWQDNRIGSIESYHIFAQHHSADGNNLWEANGIPLFQPGTTDYIGVGLGGITGAVADGLGGAVVSWCTSVNWGLLRLLSSGEVEWLYYHTSQMECWTGEPILHPSDGTIWLPAYEMHDYVWYPYIHRYSVDGEPLWGDAGIYLDFGTIPVLTATQNGVIAVHADWYSTFGRLVATRIDSSGIFEWSREVNFYMEPTAYEDISCAPDGNDGIVCAWTDSRFATVPWDRDLYAQRVQWNGVLGIPAPLEPQYTRMRPSRELDVVGKTITYKIAEPGEIMLDVYNILGQRVEVLDHTFHPRGSYTVTFNQHTLPTGIYLLRLRTNNTALTKKVIVLK